MRLLGATLWTDFALPVAQDGHPAETDVAGALAVANRRLTDFHTSQLADESIPRHRGEDVRRRLLKAEDTLAMHWVDRDWLRRELSKPFEGPTVVVTHHAPAAGSVAQRYAGDALTPAFVSELPQAMFEVPSLWVHGHTHSPFDYRMGRCRVVSNPRGYRLRDSSLENHRFNPGFTVTLAVGEVS